MAAALNVWMNGERVGVWSATRGGTPVFRYEASWLESPSARALSLSLPITAGDHEIRGDAVTNYFDNLLPDHTDIRRRLASRFRAKSADAFDLLTAIGRDCVGAVQLLPPDMTPDGWDRIRSEPLSDGEVEQILGSVTSDVPLGLHDDDGDNDLRISIAGAQEKTALLRIGNVWHRPRGATPTTHIFKLPLGLVGNRRADMSESVENEWLCALIVRELGLDVATTEMATFGQQKVLVVQRFDRRWISVPPGAEVQQGFIPPADAWIARLPQEDFCQATGTPVDRKYEADGGPTMRDCVDLLASSERAALDRTHFVLAQLVFWLLAATDGHAKNFSIFHGRRGAFRMTPLYDILSAWPIIGSGPNQVSWHKAKLAMALRSKNVHYKLRDIQPRHWQRLAETSGVPDAWGRMRELVYSVDEVLERVSALLPPGFSPRTWETVRNGMQAQAALFLQGESA